MTNRRVSLWLPVAAYMAALFWLSSRHDVPSLPGDTENHAAHFTAYAGLGLVTLRALAEGTWTKVTVATVAGAVIIASLYGMSDEFHQRFVPGRNFDVFDMLADACGAFASTSALWAWSIIRRRSKTRHAL